MNQSQLVLREVASDPDKSIKFLKNVTRIMSLHKSNWSKVVMAYLVGVLTPLVLYVLVQVIQ